ncbi:hypothetical protein B0H11DRAFT_1903848 [Mycena galericulata]|nr:hypothetical protein B0H11DRAFT_2250438 [Mycena galericulata]KAJ7475351.1 hypothetical protein B0H11DRAFT_1918047 [Mycena galericulata]KAJ7506482.1 hypothetical protein B0H11DRAFT_1903848 [Mycena galericulata]
MPSSVTPPRGMKRSSSVASLLTPPSTRKRGGFSCDSNEDITATGEYDDEGLFKRAANEESFWLAAESPSTMTLPLLHHHLRAQSQDQLDCPRQLSSPPSRRRSVVKTQTVPRTLTLKSMSSPVSSPRTPLLERRDSVFSIRRDSPENPFLASPSGSDDDEVFNAVSGSQVEKPTIAFVFRGVRLSCLNPYYNASAANPNSQLPPEHPEFEPAERPAVRKLLFGRKKPAAGAGLLGCDEDWLPG